MNHFAGEAHTGHGKVKMTVISTVVIPTPTMKSVVIPLLVIDPIDRHPSLENAVQWGNSIKH